nr:D-inositol-3-phosphate glycosyltransferase [Phytoactinopolyspora halotolerans]
MLSVHTSPLDRPGGGDAGGMNVYVLHLAKQLARLDVEVEIFTRATSSRSVPVVEACPGVTVRHVETGPGRQPTKESLSARLHRFASAVLRVEAAHGRGHYDMVHSHYWLSGQVGGVVAEHWGVPLVHSMHTMAKVKNLALAAGDEPEPPAREAGEEGVVSASDLLIANADDEAHQLVRLYGADPDQVATVWPGVDLATFTPGRRQRARARLGLAPDAVVLLYAGRIQPLKAPDVLIRAAARLLAVRPQLRSRLLVPVVGGPSGNGLARPHGLVDLARELRVDDVVRFHPPVEQSVLADWYRAADLTVVPSYNESFGLVALESQACGTPVLASSVGGLRTAVADGVSGVLLADHEPDTWARTMGELIDDPARMRRLQSGAVAHASRFGWDATAASTLDAYAVACERRRAEFFEAVTCR